MRPASATRAKKRAETVKGSGASAAARISSSERAYREIKRRILDAEFAPGAAVLEEELAKLLDMSRTPVREAMIQLAKEGMIEIRPRHGMRVLSISAADMKEIYQTLTGLEAVAADIVAGEGLKPSSLETLRGAVKDMDKALALDDLRAWAAADELFHSTLVEATNNRRLIQLVGQLWDQAHRARMLTLHLRPKPTSSNRDHEALVAAIEKRDAESARRIHYEHRARAGAMLVSVLNKLGVKQI